MLAMLSRDSQFGRPKGMWYENIEMELHEVECG